MAVNKTPGQSASGFRMYVDKDKDYNTAKLEDIKMGTQFFHKGTQYTVVELLDNMMVRLEGKNGLATRTSIVDMTELCKYSSEYKMVRL